MEIVVSAGAAVIDGLGLVVVAFAVVVVLVVVGLAFALQKSLHNIVPAALLIDAFVEVGLITVVVAVDDVGIVVVDLLISVWIAVYDK